jgi:hypothetical protein
MSWKSAFGSRKEIVLATCDTTPRAIYVISLGFIDGKLLIGECTMKTTLKNIKKNKNVSIAAKDASGYYRLNGKAEVFSSGKYLDAAIKGSKPPMPRHAIVVEIKEVYALNQGKKIL